MRKLSSQDRAALIRLASSLPPGSEERKAILSGLSQTAARKTANLGAEEPYQEVLGIPNVRNLKPDVLKVKTEKELLQLSALLDKLYIKYAKGNYGRIAIDLTPAESRALLKWGVNPVTFSQTHANYVLSVVDANGVVFDDPEDLGIGA